MMALDFITLCNTEPIKHFAFVNLTCYYVLYGQFQRVDRTQVQAAQVYVVLLSWLIDTGAAAEPAEQGQPKPNNQFKSKERGCATIPLE